MKRPRRSEDRAGDASPSTILLVGPSSDLRRRAVDALGDRGLRTMVCSAERECPLSGGGSCRLVDVADVTVIMPITVPSTYSVRGLRACAAVGRRVVIVEPSVLRQPPLGATVATSADAAQLADLVAGMLSA